MNSIDVDASGGKGTKMFVKFTGTFDANDGVTEADGVIERLSRLLVDETVEPSDDGTFKDDDELSEDGLRAVVIELGSVVALGF